MTFIDILFNPVFQILNFNINLPIDFNGNIVSFKLYHIVIVSTVIYLFGIIWSNLMGTNSSE